MKNLTLKELKDSIRIAINKNGVTIWMKEKNGQEHWILDASEIKNNGTIHIETRKHNKNHGQYEYCTTLNNNRNLLTLRKLTKKEQGR